MPDRDALPILDELRDELSDAFARFDASPGRHARRHRRWALSVGGLAAACAVAVAFVLFSGADAGRVSPPPASAAEALRDVAAVAERAAAPVPRDDQYYYVRTDASWLTTNAVGGRLEPGRAIIALAKHEREIWTSIERRGQLNDRVVGVDVLVGDSSSLPATAPFDRAPIGAQHRYRIGDERLTRAELLAFPTDPSVVYNRLLARVGQRGRSPQGQVFTEIGDALRESPAPADLRAGLYGALAHVDGVELVGSVRDRAGREGLAVAFTETGIRDELVFDPATSELLAERNVLVDPERAALDLPVGTVIGDAVFLRRAVTEDLSPPSP